LADILQLPRNKLHLFIDVSDLPHQLMCKQKRKSQNKGVVRVARHGMLCTIDVPANLEHRTERQ
jgi:hypothetical protein